MEAFDKEQRDKHDDESRVEFIPKYRHSEECLSHGKPRPLPQMGVFNGSELAKEYPLDRESEHDGKEDAHVGEDHETRIALRQIDTCRVEVWPLLEGRQHNGRCERGADGTICRKTHLLRGQNAFSHRVSGALPCIALLSASAVRCSQPGVFLSPAVETW
jgi:hypothetical protein